MSNDPSLSLSHLTPAQRQLITDLTDIYTARQRRDNEPSFVILLESYSNISAEKLSLDALLQRPLNPDNKRDKTFFHHGFDISLFTHQGDQQGPAPDPDDWEAINRSVPTALRRFHADSDLPMLLLHARLTPRPGCTLQYLGQIPFGANTPRQLCHAQLWHLAIPQRSGYYLISHTPNDLESWDNPNPWNLPNFDIRYLMTGLNPKPLSEHLVRFCLDQVADQIADHLQRPK
jgi:hypothetical protein